MIIISNYHYYNYYYPLLCITDDYYVLYFNQVYSKSKEWELLARWSVSFCNETQVYDETDSKLLDLVS